MASEFLSLASFISTFIFVGIPLTAGTTFSFTSFSPDDRSISISNGTTILDGALRLTDAQYLGKVYNNTGLAQYAQPIQLWEPSTNSTTNFTTYFEFLFLFPNGASNLSSGGFTFFMARPDFVNPEGSAGGWLGLFNQTIDADPSNNVLAVEFDTFRDQWDPSDNHVGIDVNSIVSKANQTWSNTMTSGDTLAARVSYTETSKTLRVHLQDPQVPSDVGSLNLAYQVDLRETLPEKVIVGFSASTGSSVVVQKITMWNFTSDHDKEEDEVRLVDWVWKLNGRGRVADAADWSLKHDFNAKQIETLMQVGLWCAHPDHSQRPSMRQVIQALNFEGQIPHLPDEMPVPVYAVPSLPVRYSVPSMTNSSLISGR